MSTSYSVYGRGDQEKVKYKREAYLACIKAGVPPPEELVKMFRGSLGVQGPTVPIPYREIWDEGSRLFVVDLKKLPSKVEEIVFNISW